MSKFQTARPADVAAMHWAAEATAGATHEPVELDPKAFATKRFPVRLNHYELALLQMAADLDRVSKQRAARLGLVAHCERKIKAAGLSLPGRTKR